MTELLRGAEADNTKKSLRCRPRSRAYAMLCLARSYRLHTRLFAMQKIRLISTAALLLAASSTAVLAQGRGRGRGRDDHPDTPGRYVSQEEQQRRIAEEQRRQADYQRALDAQVRAAQARTAQIQAQQRATAQLAAQQRYVQALQAQQARMRVQRDLSRDPYVTAVPTYRYRYNGATRETNQYGVKTKRGAANNGYSVGYQQGQADRSDGASSNYKRSYVSQSEYNYYFREGFRRGYSDGYATRN